MDTLTLPTDDPTSSVTFDTLSKTAEEILTERTLTATRLLAVLAAGVRQGMEILDSLGIDESLIHDAELRAIFSAIDLKREAPIADIARCAMRLLRGIGHWDDADERPFVGGSIWGPGPLAALFTRVDFDAGRLRQYAERLIDLQDRFNDLVEQVEQLRGEV